VPHHAAVDVVSDNRLMPGMSWTSEHRFDASTCPTPTHSAALIHRAFPYDQADEKHWLLRDTLMVEVLP
ncbi:MAG: hypothetical protein GWP91_19630, partial [Rhodobacterales bacterium]|nr:hypothetical protein [Rhodobacterales bacterium]